jgi:hypothetical protein
MAGTPGRTSTLATEKRASRFFPTLNGLVGANFDHRLGSHEAGLKRVDAAKVPGLERHACQQQLDVSGQKPEFIPQDFLDPGAIVLGTSKSQ